MNTLTFTWTMEGVEMEIPALVLNVYDPLFPSNSLMLKFQDPDKTIMPVNQYKFCRVINHPFL